MPSVKPKLEKLATPVTSNFPSAINSANTATPSSALPVFKYPDVDFVRTPISPPPAYADFLSKAMSLNSPAVSSLEASPESAPTSALSDKSENSSKTSLSSSKDDSSPPTSRGSSKASPPVSAISPSTYTQLPMSAPPTGAATFPSLKLPPSPAISNYDSPISAASSLRSPFSARSVRSVFDWDAALKARYADQKRAKTSRTSVRHIREVVTRTVTYTPKMEPAPRGKRRRVD